MMKKNKFFGANLKMNFNEKEMQQYATNLLENKDLLQQEIVVFPNVLNTLKARDLFSNSSILVGAQNSYYEEKGAFTGEVALKMLVDAGIPWVLLGHSERRHLFLESNDCISKKLLKAFALNLNVVLCVGETLSQREVSSQESVVSSQLSFLSELPWDSSKSQLVIAYEPVWAIGTGKVAKLEDILSMHQFIDSFLRETVKIPSTRIIYGGSVKDSNAKEILSLDFVDGVLVGGASLDPAEFLTIVNGA